MRYAKTLVMALSVLMLTLAVGAGSASATKLCSVPATGACPTANVYPSGTNIAIKLTGSLAATTSGGFPTPLHTCQSSTANLRSTSSGGASGTNVALNLTSLTFGSCSSVNPSGCGPTWPVTGLPTAGTVSWTAGTNGTLSVAWPTYTITCTIIGVPYVCPWGPPASITANVTGGAPVQAKLTNQTVPASPGGVGCGTSMTINATYVAQSVSGSPTAVYVTQS